MYARILVPLDGSNTARRGLAEAIGLLLGSDAALVLQQSPHPVLLVRGLDKAAHSA